MSSRIQFLILSILFLCLSSPGYAAVEIAWSGQKPKLINEVYNRDGVAYLAIDDVMRALRLKGRWYSVDHRYRFRTPMGKASLFPGGAYLRVGDQFIPLDHPPRFIDGRLRVPEDFVLVQLPALTGNSVYYRNLNPVGEVKSPGDESALDQLFAFLLRKKNRQEVSHLRAIAIDVGHGGSDSGVIGLTGVKEKDVVLEFAGQLEKLIKMRLGIPVYLSRDGDYTLDRKHRLQAVSKPDVDAYLILHAQGHFTPAAHGVELYVRPVAATADDRLRAGDVDDSTRLALDARQALLDEGFTVAEVHSANLLPLGRGDLPTVMIELGYLSNADDLALLKDGEARQMLAEAIFDGLKKYDDDTRSKK
ncbi:hypothetical protein C2E25_12420 [Geothermobacter hydrogeniphilus]|uniref:N-acetylmuramoyl-L-alanine amidase n=1 Tax=Geothermobacter hydrogeniphilus TaxID=1969733 RepID=A0A2K2H881_9BACT|nr:N-acetylmuramoyl-L-alanine amidase [Geothermobacter hydrogeniphilus]PNU19459.1 hypothetical protein C2E25_12420 [Geothermobacter hydrogeniphilus]